MADLGNAPQTGKVTGIPNWVKPCAGQSDGNYPADPCVATVVAKGPPIITETSYTKLAGLEDDERAFDGVYFIPGSSGNGSANPGTVVTVRPNPLIPNPGNGHKPGKETPGGGDMIGGGNGPTPVDLPETIGLAIFGIIALIFITKTRRAVV